MATVQRKVAGSLTRSPAVAGRARNPVDTSKYSGKLALHVQALREAKGLTVDDLAKKLDVPRSTMYAYEGGVRGIPADLYPALAKALGVSESEFLPKFQRR